MPTNRESNHTAINVRRNTKRERSQQCIPDLLNGCICSGNTLRTEAQSYERLFLSSISHASLSNLDITRLDDVAIGSVG